MPGPVGTWDQNYEVDDGTSARIASRPPGPTQPRSPSQWERGEALYDAYERALLLAPGAVFKTTGYALGELLKGLLPGLLQTLIVLAASTALGAAVGGVVGFFFGGVGAAPGAVVGGELGLEIGTAILSWLGLAFLAKAIIQGFGELWGVLCMGVKRAWAAPESSESEYPHQIERAAHDLADAVGILVLLILQAIVAWVFTRAAIGSTKGVIQTAGSNRLASGEAANASVAALVQELRASRLGSTFADWVEQNWERLRDDPRLRFRSNLPGDQAGPVQGGEAANRSSFERYKNTLRAEMSRPAATDAKLSALLDQMYRPGAKVGSGSTAAAVRQEIATGQPVGGQWHTQKAQDSIAALINWLKKNPSAAPGDRAAAENVIVDLQNALSGK